MKNREVNKQIARNVIFLYIRMFLSLAVSLYTSRVLLRTLGIEDFGIYNVVGGVIAMFSFLNTSMSTVTARFITFEIESKRALQQVFTSAFVIHGIIALALLVVGELIGGYIVHEVLNIPLARLHAAQWIYHFALFSACASVVQVPYNAMIVAHERFNVFAYLDVGNSILKLLVVYLLLTLKGDALILYGFLVFLVSLLVFLSNLLYAKRSFNDCTLQFSLNGDLVRRMLSFCGWDLYGNLSVLARTQGVNILLNIFFGASINAASGVATQVQAAVGMFANSAITAVRPQIIKSYASGDFARTTELVTKTAKYTYIILLLISLPLILEMEYVLSLWLGTVPTYAVSFCRCVLVFNFLANTSSVVVSALHAAGKVKGPSLINGSLYLMVVPLSYLAFTGGSSPVVSYQINILMVAFGMLSNAWTLSLLLPHCSVRAFIGEVCVPTLVVTAGAAGGTIWSHWSLEPGLISLISTTGVSSVLILVLSYLVAISSREKEFIRAVVARKLHFVGSR